jgi:cell division protease FtsH
LPSLKGREDILKLYAKKFKLAKSINLKDVARGTTGFSGADLENLLNEAALAAARLGRKQIEMADIDEARDKNLMGPKKNRKIRDWDKKMTAYHEAGHAFISMHYDDLVDPILKATIIPRGQALGMVQHLPIDDKVSMTVAEIKANMAVAMGGRAAEMVFMGPSKITTGAESDIAKATRLARYSITVAGLSDKIGSIAINQADTFGARHSLETASEKTIQMVDDEIKAWVDAAYSDAIKILTRSKSTVKKLAEELLKRETLSMAEIEKIIRKK